MKPSVFGSCHQRHRLSPTVTNAVFITAPSVFGSCHQRHRLLGGFSHVCVCARIEADPKRSNIFHSMQILKTIGDVGDVGDNKEKIGGLSVTNSKVGLVTLVTTKRSELYFPR